MKKGRNVPEQVAGEGSLLTPRGLPRTRGLDWRTRLAKSRYLEGELGGSFNALDLGFHGVKEFVSK
jgi:hypothetical protein